MRIAEISTAACQCGISTYTEFLSEALIQQGHEVKVFGEKRVGDVPYRVPYEICYKREEPQSYVNLVHKLDEWKPDIVHFQYEWALHMTDGPLLELAKTRPHFITWHNVVGDAKSMFYGRLADGNIVHNDACFRAIVALGLHMASVSVIPHGTRINKIYPKATAKAYLNINPKRKVIAVYGFISERKGYHTVLNSLAQIQEFCPNAFFLIIGGHQSEAANLTANYVDLFNVAEELYPDDVRVTGFVDDSKADVALSAADMVVFPHMGGDEIISASGSIRRTIDHARLTATADIGFYSDFPSTSVLKIPKDLNANTVGRWLGRWLARTGGDDVEVNTLTQNLKDQARDSYWSKVARSHALMFLDYLSKEKR